MAVAFCVGYCHYYNIHIGEKQYLPIYSVGKLANMMIFDYLCSSK